MSDSSLDRSSSSLPTLECFNAASAGNESVPNNLRLMTANDQIRELQTVIRDKYAYL